MEIQIPSSTGVGYDDETDELTPLSEYAARSIERANNGKPKEQHYVCYRRSMLGLRTDQL